MTRRPDGVPVVRRVVHGALWTGASHVLLFAAGLTKAVILARIIDRELFGLVAGAAVWTSYLGIARLDLRIAAFNSREETEILDTQFLLENLSAAIGFPVAAAAMAVWPALLPPAGWALVFLLLAAAQFEALTSTSVYLVEKRLRQDVMGRLTMASAVMGPVVVLALALGGRPLLALAIDAVWPVLIPRAGAVMFAGWRPRFRWTLTQARTQLRLAWTIWVSSLLSKITFQFDDWLVFNTPRPHPVLWRSTGVAAEAVYDRAYRVAKLPMDLAAGMIAANALAIYAERAARGRDQVADAYRRISWLLAWIISASSAYLFVAADELVYVLGEQWLPMVPLLRLSALFMVGRPLIQNAAQVLLALDRSDDVRRTFAVQAVFLVVVAPFTVIYAGAAGAAVAVSVMSALGLITADRLVARHLGGGLWRRLAAPASAGVAAVGLAWVVAGAVSGATWYIAVVKAAVCAAVFAVALAALDRAAALDAWRTLRRGWTSV